MSRMETRNWGQLRFACSDRTVSLPLSPVLCHPTGCISNRRTTTEQQLERAIKLQSLKGPHWAKKLPPPSVEVKIPLVSLFQGHAMFKVFLSAAFISCVLKQKTRFENWQTIPLVMRQLLLDYILPTSLAEFLETAKKLLVSSSTTY